ncbi:unnamed protein product [Cylicocyclus nassatus]|uniref:Phlebovirus glycoprotein G2 fusion domain-containing protein n=1 Tax=Cylicocyclus nassatus TaxID=53992 RepID=A0AA36M910_CYLNA|nr:unnamed protein product [Cylicocyclus nassatus]
MAGPTSLKVAKALLTRYCNNLQRLTEESEKALKTEELKVWNMQQSQEVQRKVMELEANINLVSQSLEKFANVVDTVMESVTEEQEQQVQEYIDKAQTTIDQAQKLTIQLESARISARDHAGDPTRPTSSSLRAHGEAPTSQLPPIPVPTFTGELWDFENFWRLFEANVDHQPLTKLQKFNYLINALRGEARELVNRFTVTEDNYEEAIAMLRRKYGDKSRLVAKLQQRLEETYAANTSTTAQRRLLETIIPLISQLEAHKRKILQQYITPEMQEKNWHIKDIITALDDCISTEERISEMMTYTTNATNTYTRRTRTIPYREDTIQRRNDGYYVRLPFKEDHPYLPNNRAIAKKRLNSVLLMLKSKPDLLQAYDQALKDQLEKGIIQEIPGDEAAVGKHLHYIPHQPVIMPHKEITKLRIVFDASSHFKDCPSLNDVLYQGPLILPDLYAMLLRFRMASFAATADVEKAFLQVHLHELDRDATRFLWVRHINSPAEEDNIVTYRFTRVIFGLNVSPFLLAGTIQYHLEHSVIDRPLAKEIRENLITMTTIALPPTPTLGDMFITDGEETSIWQEPFETDLFCSTWQKANSSDCILRDSCQWPAESWVNCQCLSKDLTQEFNRVDLKLPVQRSSGELRIFEGILTAKIPQMVSAEFILATEQTVSTEQVKVLVKQGSCTIPDSEITGCYNCVKGAEAKIQCSSSRETLAEVLCEQDAFVVPCAPNAPQSTLQFHLNHAKQLLNCSVYCGDTHQFFVLTGVLKYVGNWRAPMLQMMARNSTVYGEFAWPDFTHILEVFFAWYKTLAITLVGVGLLVLIIYLSFQGLGISAFWTILRFFARIVCLPMHIVVKVGRCLQRTTFHNPHQKTV